MGCLFYRASTVYARTVSEVEARRYYWAVAPIGSLHVDVRASDHLPVLVRVSVKRARTARLARLSPELARPEEYQECLARMKGIERVEDFEERYFVMAELAHRAARQARTLLFKPNLSQSALLVEAAMRVYVLAKVGKMQVAGEVAAAVPRIARVWRNGMAQPTDMLSLCRLWAEEAVMIRRRRLSGRCCRNMTNVLASRSCADTLTAFACADVGRLRWRGTRCRASRSASWPRSAERSLRTGVASMARSRQVLRPGVARRGVGMAGWADTSTCSDDLRQRAWTRRPSIRMVGQRAAGGAQPFGRYRLQHAGGR